mmetsp:Transcript_2746/g.9661  ORF Transcript_2746/g.9661 Transcript_2746/m.9661 type:complete len:227 (+) Transcript_2746:1417-2097(+)
MPRLEDRGVCDGVRHGALPAAGPLHAILGHRGCCDGPLLVPCRPDLLPVLLQHIPAHAEGGHLLLLDRPSHRGQEDGHHRPQAVLDVVRGVLALRAAGQIPACQRHPQAANVRAGDDHWPSCHARRAHAGQGEAARPLDRRRHPPARACLPDPTLVAGPALPRRPVAGLHLLRHRARGLPHREVPLPAADQVAGALQLRHIHPAPPSHLLGTDGGPVRAQDVGRYP